MISSNLADSMSKAYRSPKILIIEDDHEWCNLIQIMAQNLGYSADAAKDPEEVKSKIRLAEDINDPYLVATIDINFEFGKKGVETPLGKEILKFIKKHYPYIACIVISAISVAPENILDLRDDYSLDYYLQKQELDSYKFQTAVRKALDRVRPLGDSKRRHEVLQQSLEKWKDVYAIYSNNLALAREKEALKGIDADVSVRNEIEIYKSKLEEIKITILDIEEILQKLQ